MFSSLAQSLNAPALIFLSLVESTTLLSILWLYISVGAIFSTVSGMMNSVAFIGTNHKHLPFLV